MGLVGLGVSQKATETVVFGPDSTFNTTALGLEGSVNDAFDWIPLLILCAVGGIALAYVFGFTNSLNPK